MAGPPPHRRRPDRAGDRAAFRALVDAVGGVGALVDSSLPTLAFAITYAVAGRTLRPALIAALAAGGLLVVVRLVRREALRNVLGGFVVVALAAAVAAYTGRASNYYLISLIRAFGLAFVYALSALIRWPVIGLLLGAAHGHASAFRSDPVQLRAYTRATWLWVGLFALRLVVRAPLLLSNSFGWLTVTDVVMGWPLFVAWVGLTYLLLRHDLDGPVWEATRERLLRRGQPPTDPDGGPEEESVGGPGPDR